MVVQEWAFLSGRVRNKTNKHPKPQNNYMDLCFFISSVREIERLLLIGAGVHTDGCRFSLIAPTLLAPPAPCSPYLGSCVELFVGFGQ